MQEWGPNWFFKARGQVKAFSEIAVDPARAPNGQAAVNPPSAKIHCLLASAHVNDNELEMKELVPSPPAIVRNDAAAVLSLYQKNVVPSYARFEMALSHGSG